MATQEQVDKVAGQIMDILQDEGFDMLLHNREQEEANLAYTNTIMQVADLLKNELKKPVPPGDYEPSWDEVQEELAKKAAKWTPEELMNHISPNTIYREMYSIWLKRLVADDYDKFDRFILKYNLRGEADG